MVKRLSISISDELFTRLEHYRQQGKSINISAICAQALVSHLDAREQPLLSVADSQRLLGLQQQLLADWLSGLTRMSRELQQMQARLGCGQPAAEGDLP